MDLEKIQASLRELKLPGWLLYDFHGSNPIARHVIGLGPDRLATRRWFGLIPERGEPVWLHHAIEAHLFADLPGKRIPFVAYRALQDKLKLLVQGGDREAMEYAPGGIIPYVSRADAGTLTGRLGCTSPSRPTCSPICRENGSRSSLTGSCRTSSSCLSREWTEWPWSTPRGESSRTSRGSMPGRSSWSVPQESRWSAAP